MQWTWIGLTAALGFAGVTALTNGSAGSHGGHESNSPRPGVWVVAGEDAAERRLEMLRRARFDYQAPAEPMFPESILVGTIGFAFDDATPLDCRFVPSKPSGTSPKFDCALADGRVVKVKYGRNPEIHAETAATALLRQLGYASDSVAIVPRLRCHGCPRFPFAAMALSGLFAVPFAPEADEDDVEEFAWVSVEERFPAPAIETADVSGWAWWELAGSFAPRADVDAFRLTAVFLAHWDNKSENQRLVCLDQPLPAPDGDCHDTLAMIQDVGATFGPTKANLARWRELPVWRDRATCTISMAAMPHGGGSFPEGRVSEAGRAILAGRLSAIPDAEVERLFADALFPRYQIGTDDEGDLKAWVAAFRDRANQIVHARCPEVPDET